MGGPREIEVLSNFPAYRTVLLLFLLTDSQLVRRNSAVLFIRLMEWRSLTPIRVLILMPLRNGLHPHLFI